MAADNNRIIHGEVLPPESRGVAMPGGTPFGLAILGAARFNAIRRVIDQYERALRAKEAAILAEGAVANAIAHREVAREKLRHLDMLREEEAERIKHLAAVNKLRREVERMELEDQVAELKARRVTATAKQSAAAEPSSPKAAPDDFSAFMDDLRKLPGVVNAVAAAKDQILKAAGGEENLSEAQRQVCEMFDAMLQSFVAKRAGEAAL